MASGTDRRQRNVTVTVRLTADERARLEELSSRAGYAAGAFMRAAAFGEAGPRAQRRPPADHVAIRKLLGELGRVGNNINQIARAVNADQSVNVPELREALTAYLELRDAIFVALGMEPSGDYQGRKQGRA
ncbi:MAG: plasmid mobilization relaxosome protein MobC [Acetobacteraceae bacterium]